MGLRMLGAAGRQRGTRTLSADGDSQGSTLTLTTHLLLTSLEHIRPPVILSRVLSQRSLMPSAPAPRGFLCPHPTVCRVGEHPGALPPPGVPVGLRQSRAGGVSLRIPPAGAFLLPFKPS